MNISGVYHWCMEATGGDAEYCADVKDVAAQVAATRVFSHVHNNIRFLLVLPDVIFSKLIDEEDTVVLFAARTTYAAKILIDEQKKGIAVLLEAPNHIVTLIYERKKEGKPILKKTMVTNHELSALINSPFKLSE
jgi:hypothetical protein